MIMPLAKKLSSKFHLFHFSGICLFFGQSLSPGHYPPISILATGRGLFTKYIVYKLPNYSYYNKFFFPRLVFVLLNLPLLRLKKISSTSLTVKNNRIKEKNILVIDEYSVTDTMV